ncbi:hypothetical protein RRF57_005066 [Xylaria bambusicola]|uniref:Uncharacterized protein n=1 Tax=Xylaria bambusicola TaxID=326684 RepID=A0AAN7UJ20_9PEZI
MGWISSFSCSGESRGTLNQSAITRREDLPGTSSSDTERKKRGLSGKCDKASEIQTASNRAAGLPSAEKCSSIFSASSSTKRQLPPEEYESTSSVELPVVPSVEVSACVSFLAIST